MKDNKKKLIRLQVYLSRSGVASRRKCEDLITAGRVKINGIRVQTLGTKCTIDDEVTLDGRVIEPEEKPVYIALNKPAGYLCSNHDPYGRPLAIDLIGSEYHQRLFHVGRLDVNSCGLIFYTNDGLFAKTVTHPSAEVEKEYMVETNETIDPVSLQKMKRGISIKRELYRIDSYALLMNNSVQLCLHEGKKREIRHLFSFFHYTIKTLYRTRIGPVTVGTIPLGTYRELTTEEFSFFTGLQQEKL